MIRNKAGQCVHLHAIDHAGNDITSGTPSVFVTKEATAQAAGVNSATHKGNGLWEYELTQAETNSPKVSIQLVFAGEPTAAISVYTKPKGPVFVTGPSIIIPNTALSLVIRYGLVADTVLLINDGISDTEPTSEDLIGSDQLEVTWDPVPIGLSVGPVKATLNGEVVWVGQVYNTIAEADLQLGGKFNIQLEIRDSEDNPVSFAQVYLTATALSSARVIDEGYANDDGLIEFNLTAGTYYAWRNKSNVSFDDPVGFTVSDAGVVTAL